jgi:hypothetical protein
MGTKGRGTVTFDLSDGQLATIITELRGHLGATLHPEAWHIFTLEQERRAAKGHPMPFPVHLSTAVYEALPAMVRVHMQPRLRSLPRTTKAVCPTCEAHDVICWMTVNAGVGDHPPVEPIEPNDDLWGCRACGEAFIKLVG